MKLHLGCGNHYKTGWINVDLNSPIADQHFDILFPFPCDSLSVDFIYSDHLIEHFTSEEGIRILRECNRILRKEGVLRISTPNLQVVVSSYLDGGWKESRIKHKFACDFINIGFRSWGHKFLYDYDRLEYSLYKAQFSSLKRVEKMISIYPELCNLDCRNYQRENDVRIEAIK